MSTAPNGYQEPKTNWQAADVVQPVDANRIEGNINAIEQGERTVDPAQAPTGVAGNLRQFLDWFANRLKAITGKTNWYDAPDITLASLNAHAVRHQPGGADAIPTAAPSGGLGTANAVGSSTSLARADHTHLAFDSTNPEMDGTASPGVATVAARRDHVHPSDTSRAAVVHPHNASDIPDFAATVATLDADSVDGLDVGNIGVMRPIVAISTEIILFAVLGDCIYFKTTSDFRKVNIDTGTETVLANMPSGTCPWASSWHLVVSGSNRLTLGYVDESEKKAYICHYVPSTNTWGTPIVVVDGTVYGIAPTAIRLTWFNDNLYSATSVSEGTYYIYVHNMTSQQELTKMSPGGTVTVAGIGIVGGYLFCSYEKSSAYNSFSLKLSDNTASWAQSSVFSARVLVGDDNVAVAITTIAVVITAAGAKRLGITFPEASMPILSVADNKLYMAHPWTDDGTKKTCIICVEV
jgi:hypothetical protein